MAGWLVEDRRSVIHAAAFRVIGAEIQAADAGEGNGGGAHRARLQRDIEVKTRQPLSAAARAGGADGQNFRMGGRVAQFTRPVARRGDDPPAFRIDNDGADRRLIPIGGGARLAQRLLHIGRERGHEGVEP